MATIFFYIKKSIPLKKIILAIAKIYYIFVITARLFFLVANLKKPINPSFIKALAVREFARTLLKKLFLGHKGFIAALNSYNK